MFKDFKKAVYEKFQELTQSNLPLFLTGVEKDKLWDMYINSFPSGSDPLTGKEALFYDKEEGRTVKVEATEHTCKACRQFIRPFGNVVAVIDNKLVSIWDIDTKGISDHYVVVAKALAKLAKSKPIVNIFKHDTNELGIDKNHKMMEDDTVREYNHFYAVIPNNYITTGSIPEAMGRYRTSKEVLKRGLDEIHLDSLVLAKDLINQGSLLDGDAHLNTLEDFIKLREQYDNVQEKDKDNWAWLNAENRVARFRNTLMGVFCVELSEGKELNETCLDWNKRVDPANYHKVKSPITKRQIEEAKKFVIEHGYEESFNRRLATMDDIKATEILHINRGDGNIKNVSIFDNIKTPSSRHKRNEFDKVEEVSIDKFMKDILPSCTSVEALLLNSHESNLANITTANIEDSKPIFKWDNNYSYTLNGNLAGISQIKEAVKGRGGNVDGVLNIRLAFPDTTCDYDLHVFEPNGDKIYYGNVRKQQRSSGMLDLDAQGVDGHQPPEKRVENVIYTDLNKMPKGDYTVLINDYSRSKFPAKFTVEVEFDSNTTTFELSSKPGNNANVCVINLNNNQFTIKKGEHVVMTDSNVISKELWGLETNNFHKVNLMCLTPNHWGENNTGNKYYMFMLDGCKNSNSVRGFHNEHLIGELLSHRKVMDVLGASTLIEPTDKQLAGLAFNSTVKDELIVRVKGTFQRVLKIKF